MSNGFTYASSSGATYGTEHGSIWGGRLDAVIGWLLDDEIVADALVGSHPPHIQGEEAEFTFRFDTSNGFDPEERYTQLRERVWPAPATVVTQEMDGTPRYKEQHSQEESLVVRIEPGKNADSAQGIWGLITDYDDDTTRPDVQAVMSLTVVVLAYVEEYATLESLEDDLLIQDLGDT